MFIADLHCDTILDIIGKNNCCLRENSSHIDCKKLSKSNYISQNFAMFIDIGKTKNPFYHVNNMIDIFLKEISNNDDIISFAKSYSDICNNISNGKISAILTIEEGEACEGSTEKLLHLYNRGVRMMTFTWNYKNSLASPNSNENKTAYVNNNEGLTEKGFEILEAMEQYGIIPDVSHLSDKGFFDVASKCKKPFVASHSNAREICSHPRNLTDSMIKIIGEKGGIIGLNYCNSFISDSYEKGRGIDISLLLPHINHIIDVGGEDCIAIGTDFDGIDNPPLQIPDASQQINLIKLLEKQGFKTQIIEKICYKNVMRLYKDVLR